MLRVAPLLQPAGSACFAHGRVRPGTALTAGSGTAAPFDIQRPDVRCAAEIQTQQELYQKSLTACEISGNKMDCYLMADGACSLPILRTTGIKLHSSRFVYVVASPVVTMASCSPPGWVVCALFCADSAICSRYRHCCGPIVQTGFQQLSSSYHSGGSGGHSAQRHSAVCSSGELDY